MEKTTMDQVIGMLLRLNRNLEDLNSDGRFIVTRENNCITIRNKSSNGVILSGLTKKEAYNTLYAMARSLEMVIFAMLMN